MLAVINCFDDIDIVALREIYEETLGQMRDDYSDGYGPYNSVYQCLTDDLLDFFRVSNSKLFLWVSECYPVAAVRCEPHGDGVLISYLETKPCMRGNGYATALLCATIEHLKSYGVKQIYSHVNKRNKASLSVHKASGFQIQDDFAKLLDGTISQNYYTLQYKSTAE